MVTDKEVLLHLKEIQRLIANACETGWNPQEGDWAEGLFNTNRKTSDILKQHTGSYNGSTLEEEEEFNTEMIYRGCGSYVHGRLL